MAPDPRQYPGYESSRPYTRWWWLNGPFRKEDIMFQLDWLNANGFGGVELAWMDPFWQPRRGEEPRPAWLSEEWSELVAFTKRYADSLGLGCDFTFGSGLPSGGGSQVGLEHAAQTLNGPSPQRVAGSWEQGRWLVADRLSEDALRASSAPLASALAPSLAGSLSALCCDAQELDAAELWSAGLWDEFEARYGYRLEGRLELARTHPHMRYEYRRMVGSAMQRAFFDTYARICRELGAVSRVQCHGVPVDLLAACATVDVPESEAPLFGPPFSRIPASAAALTGKDLVSAEAFTGIYGTVAPGDLRAGRYWRKEQLADLKLLADAILANGVNQIVWHGMPYNPPGGQNEFMASVHVGPDAPFARDLPAFNAYLETVCGMLRRGRPYAQLAVYLPNEDMLVQDRLPEELRTPGAAFVWEMRHVAPPPETEGYHPVWVSEPFLRHAEYLDGQITIGGLNVQALYLDVEWLDAGSLEELVQLALAGAPVVLKRTPAQPGMRRHPEYAGWLATLTGLPNVVTSLDQLKVQPLVTGADLPYFWAREGAGELLIFFAHPLAREIRYPMTYGQSYCEAAVERVVTLTYGRASREVTLRFEPYQSLMVRFSRSGEFSVLDLGFRPPAPVRDTRL